jgi:NADPH:quinone reductase-like Zn-dependent oxidoreductase
MKNKDVKSNIYKKFKLDKAEEAHKTIQSRESSGSIILEP